MSSGFDQGSVRSRGMFALGLGLTLLVGCGDTSGGNDDQGLGMCTGHGDCADDRFCNGSEICDPTSLAADSRGCAPGSLPCAAGQTCNEMARMCTGTCLDADADDDGHDAVPCGGDDCDDGDDNRFPGNAEVCDTEEHDEDCDHTTVGSTDVDTDTYIDSACCNASTLDTRRCGTDCDDGASGVNPNVPEVCNGIDDDCSGEEDDGASFTCVLGDQMACDPADGPAGMAACTATCDSFGACISADEGPSVAGSCNGRDDDGDTVADENFFCVQAASEACTTTCGTSGTRVCQSDCGSFGTCVAAVESCNYCDDNGVNGVADEIELAQSSETVRVYDDITVTYAGSAGGFSIGGVSLHEESQGTAGSAWFPGPFTLGYDSLDVEMTVFMQRSPCNGTLRGGYALMIAKDQAGLSGTVGAAGAMGLPADFTGYAGYVQLGYEACNTGHLQVRNGVTPSPLGSTICASGQPAVASQLANTGTEANCYATQVLRLHLEPDVPGTAPNEMRVTLVDGAGTMIGSCSGAACSVRFQPGDTVHVAATGAGSSSGTLGVDIQLPNIGMPQLGYVSMGLCD